MYHEQVEGHHILVEVVGDKLVDHVVLVLPVGRAAGVVGGLLVDVHVLAVLHDLGLYLVPVFYLAEGGELDVDAPFLLEYAVGLYKDCVSQIAVVRTFVLLHIAARRTDGVAVFGMILFVFLVAIFVELVGPTCLLEQTREYLAIVCLTDELRNLVVAHGYHLVRHVDISVLAFIVGADDARLGIDDDRGLAVDGIEGDSDIAVVEVLICQRALREVVGLVGVGRPRVDNAVLHDHLGDGVGDIAQGIVLLVHDAVYKSVDGIVGGGEDCVVTPRGQQLHNGRLGTPAQLCALGQSDVVGELVAVFREVCGNHITRENI